MQPPIDRDRVEKPDVGTVLTYRSLVDADGLSAALLEDVPSVPYSDAFRELGLTQVSFWIQRDPDAAVVLWEGTDIGTLFDRFEASSNPILARWRGQLRGFSGPDEADSFWDASHHRLLHWSTEEHGAEGEVKIHTEPRQVEAYIQLSKDFQKDPAMFRFFDRVRRRQGFTRIETWHQHQEGSDVLLCLVEARDLEDAWAQFQAEDNEIDKRIMDLMRSVFTVRSPAPAKLLIRWHARDPIEGSAGGPLRR